MKTFFELYVEQLAEAKRYLEVVADLQTKHKIDLGLHLRTIERGFSVESLVIEDNTLKIQVNYDDYEGYDISNYYIDMPDNVDQGIKDVTSKCLQMVNEREQKRKEAAAQKLAEDEAKERELLKKLLVKFPDQ